ncbi:MAG: pyridoxal 5'-phosphate synthase glutaminase subunit PdxT [Candidatus Heimdallarchaeota archaeon]
MKKLRIGVLALQGDVSEHVTYFAAAAKDRDGTLEITKVKDPASLDGLHGLVIPGGETTTMARLMGEKTETDFGPLQSKIREMAKEGIPIFGVCAGAILLSKEILDRPSDNEYRSELNLLDAAFLRNAYGRQRESFEIALTISALGDRPFAGVFIRAPQIQQVGDNVDVLGYLDTNPILVRQENLLAATFHPELTNDYRVADYFLTMCANGK